VQSGEAFATASVLTAAIAIEANLRVFTRNAEHFGRVRGLKLAR
jgi:predicted nucleic acid-binding protein